VFVEVIVGGVGVLLMLTATHSRGYSARGSHCARRKKGQRSVGDAVEG
jgi:hypothetical protein